MRILGISAFYHDSAAALIEDGRIIAAAQEERFNRKKHYAGFPDHAVAACLRAGHCSFKDIDFVAFYEKPFVKFERLLETYVDFVPRGFASFARAMPIWIKEKLFQKDLLIKKLRAAGAPDDIASRLLFSEHHQSHAASAFFPSPFEEAAVLTMDGVGEWTTTSQGIGSGNKLDLHREIQFPHSLGLLYSAFTYYTGFKVNSGEYKVMGLAPYGTPHYAKLILEHLVDLKADGSFRLNLDYFDYCTGLKMTNSRFDDLFGGPARKPEQLLTQRDMDLAASIQDVTETIVLKLGRAIARETGQKNLCLAGGVALNCVANGKLLRDGCFDQIWIQPAAGDAGAALGAALTAYYQHCHQPRPSTTALDHMNGGYLGPEYSDAEIEAELSAAGARFRPISAESFFDSVIDGLIEGKAVGWFQGRMEFGPRALGARSILGDARSPTMQKKLNLKIKYRESFRPFAPSCLAEDVSTWFELDRASPYMLLVADVVPSKRRAMTASEDALFGIEKLNVPRSEIPAVTHVDYSARIQTVHRDTNPRYHELLTRFKAKTGCGVLVNTSFNVRGEPIVGSPNDAFRCFMGTEMDILAIGNFLLVKEDQDPALRKNYETAFEPD